MTQFWRHYQRSATRGNWVILLMKVATATENSRYTNLLCCDEKLHLSIWIYYQHRWTFILTSEIVCILITYLTYLILSRHANFWNKYNSAIKHHRKLIEMSNLWKLLKISRMHDPILWNTIPVACFLHHKLYLHYITLIVVRGSHQWVGVTPKLSYLKNLKLFSIRVKELSEPIGLWRKGDGF